MKKLLLTLGALSLIGAASYVSAGEACLGTGDQCSTTTDVEVTLEGGDICIGSEDNFNFGTFTVSDQAQTTSGQFSGVFYVDDQKGSDDGYYTTVEIADLVDGANSIDAANVSFRSSFTVATTVGSSPITGGPNANVYTDADVLNTWAALDTPKEFINRDAAANLGVIGQYGEMPFLQLVIPAYTPVGEYHGDLTYTLYEPGH